jgi:hypothetical protein
VGSDFGAFILRVNTFHSATNDGLMDAVFDVGAGVRGAVQAFVIGIVLGEQQGRQG